jgi:ferredoxin
MGSILAKKSLAAWARKLSPRALWAPALEGGAWNYAPLRDPDALRLDFPQTVQSPKKIVFPQREVLLDIEGDAARERLPAVEPTVVFGVRPCDAHGLLLTDKVFDAPFRDPYYWRRREATALVGLACTPPPSPNCFCPTLGGSPAGTEGLDVLMTDLGAAWHVEALAERGRELVALGGALFTAATEQDRARRDERQVDAAGRIRRRVERLDAVPGLLRGLFDSPRWEAIAAPCIRCGICTYLCPTCHCFDIGDELSSTNPVRGERVRTWDTCQFPDFTMHSSGHNPRPDKAARQRQRVLHKFLYFPDTQGAFQCTGCGRCITHCPVGVDLIEILNEVRPDGA